jgi:stage V sporulation protein G
MVRGLKVIREARGYSVEMPRRKLPDGTYFDFVTPINAEARKLIEDRILAEFEKLTNERVHRRTR